MKRPMSQEPIDALIRRLAGDEPAGSRADRDPATENMRLAAYLDGGMTAEERAAFEQELAHSAGRREDLLSAVAWSDEIDAKREHAPDHVVQQVLALDAMKTEASRGIWWRGWLPASRRQWIFAGASALACVLVALIALQILSGPSFRLPEHVSTLNPQKIEVTAELMTALSAFDRNQGSQEQAKLVGALRAAALKSATTIFFDLDKATFDVAKPLHERLQQRDPVKAVSLGAGFDGHLVLGLAD